MSSLRDRRWSLPGSAPVEFGVGAVRRVPAVLVALGVRRAFVVTDPGIRAAGVLASVLTCLDEAGIPHAEYAEVRANPTTEDVERAVAVCAELLGHRGLAADATDSTDSTSDVAVLALGGGSALDVAKGVGLLARGATMAEALRPGEHRGLPLVAVPTTAGTGAETNGFAVLGDPVARTKLYLGSASVRPRVSILDPELTVGLPPRVTAATGMDALTHGIESLASRGASPLSEAYALRAVTLVSGALERGVRDGSDLEARSRLLFGAHLAGLALTLSGLGLVHGIAHATTGHTGAPHGLALSAVLDTVMSATAPAAGEAYAEVARAMGAGSSPAAAVEATRALAESVGARGTLSGFGATEAMLPALARDALADVVSRNAPWLPEECELTEMLLTRL